MNFGQIAFFGIGGYAAAMSAQAGVSAPAGILIGMAVAAVAGALVGCLNPGGGTLPPFRLIASAALVGGQAVGNEAHIGGNRLFR